MYKIIYIQLTHFSMNIYNLVHSNDSMYKIFQRMYTIQYIQHIQFFKECTQFRIIQGIQFFKESLQFCKFNVPVFKKCIHNFSKNIHNFVPTTYIIMYIIRYVQHIHFLMNVHNVVYSTYTIFQRVCPILYFQCTYFSNNLNNSVHSTYTIS